MTLTAVINPVVPLNLLFPHQRVICPHSRQSANYRIVTHNFTNDDLTDGNSPSYHYVYIFSYINFTISICKHVTTKIFNTAIIISKKLNLISISYIWNGICNIVLIILSCYNSNWSILKSPLSHRGRKNEAGCKCTYLISYQWIIIKHVFWS